MKAMSSEVGKISFGVTMVSRQLSVSDCPRSALVPSKEYTDYTDFLTELPKINDNNTITLNFRDDKNFLSNIGGGLQGIEIYVYFLPIGTKAEDLSYKVDIVRDRCIYKGLLLPSGDLATTIKGTAVGPRGNREGMLKFNIENKGYTGLNGDVRLYIVVYFFYRNSRDVFYVN
jgi:hypothetical protein